MEIYTAREIKKAGMILGCIGWILFYILNWKIAGLVMICMWGNNLERIADRMSGR